MAESSEIVWNWHDYKDKFNSGFKLDIHALEQKHDYFVMHYLQDFCFYMSLKLYHTTLMFKEWTWLTGLRIMIQIIKRISSRTH